MHRRCAKGSPWIKGDLPGLKEINARQVFLAVAKFFPEENLYIERHSTEQAIDVKYNNKYMDYTT